MHCAQCGEPYTFPRSLTKSEFLVAGLVAEGLRDKDIASRLNISLKTVKFHTGNIYRKMGLKSRYELISLHNKHPEVFQKTENAQS